MKFVVTSLFGALEEIRSGVSHKGIDLQMPTGTKLRSITDGIVERVTDYGGKSIGTGVIIRAKDGSTHIFGHMDSVSVKPGDHIHSGDLIGTSGNSGFSTGSHLHFGLWKDGKYQDPSHLIEKVDAMAGSMGPLKGTGILTDLIISNTREKAKETATETIWGILDAIKDVTLDIEYSVCLIGSGILIILRACGFKHAWLRPSVLLALHVIIRLLLGGFAL
jgi:hypothetical protein